MTNYSFQDSGDEKLDGDDGGGARRAHVREHLGLAFDATPRDDALERRRHVEADWRHERRAQRLHQAVDDDVGGRVAVVRGVEEDLGLEHVLVLGIVRPRRLRVVYRHEQRRQLSVLHVVEQLNGATGCREAANALQQREERRVDGFGIKQVHACASRVAWATACSRRSTICGASSARVERRNERSGTFTWRACARTATSTGSIGRPKATDWRRRCSRSCSVPWKPYSWIAA